MCVRGLVEVSHTHSHATWYSDAWNPNAVHIYTDIIPPTMYGDRHRITMTSGSDHPFASFRCIWQTDTACLFVQKNVADATNNFIIVPGMEISQAWAHPAETAGYLSYQFVIELFIPLYVTVTRCINSTCRQEIRQYIVY